ncbi:MAG: TlpA family protein disulfide reductase [Leptospiraceae bacterium]|nr:TlpA family protein disulfide reductase [Leptospiraceae bacterium]
MKSIKPAIHSVLLLLLSSLIWLQPVSAEEAFGSVFLEDLKTSEKQFLKKYIQNGPLIINFWATYCQPCAAEMPAIQKLAAENLHVRLLFINIDAAQNRVLVQKKVADWGISETVLLDIYQIAAKKYVPSLSVPATFLVNSKGQIFYQSIGYNRNTIRNLQAKLQLLKK